MLSHNEINSWSESKSKEIVTIIEWLCVNSDKEYLRDTITTQKIGKVLEAIYES